MASAALLVTVKKTNTNISFLLSFSNMQHNIKVVLASKHISEKCVFTAFQCVNMKEGFMKMDKSSGLPVVVHAFSVHAR